METREIKKDVRQQILEMVERDDKPSRSSIQKNAYTILEGIEKKQKTALGRDIKEEIVQTLCDDLLGLGPLQALIDDEEVTEVMVNGPHMVYVEKMGKKSLSKVKFDDEEHLRYIIERMLYPTRKNLDEKSPYVDFTLRPGIRVNAIIPPLAAGGPVLTIRKLLRSIRKSDDLMDLNTIDRRIGDFLISCIKAKMNLLFSGATGSGKTTTLAVLTYYIDPQERIVTIEDALELYINQDHVVRLLTRPQNIEGKGEVTLRDLLRNALRMRPSRIVLGEIRGAEAMDYLQALTSGHTGCLAVIHASNPSDAITRLETMALYAGLDLPSWAIRQQIASGLDFIVQQEQLVDGSRKVTHVTEVEGLEGNQVVLRDIFRYEIERTGGNQETAGKFVALGAPTSIDRFLKRGVPVDEAIFEEKILR